MANHPHRHGDVAFAVYWQFDGKGEITVLPGSEVAKFPVKSCKPPELNLRKEWMSGDSPVIALRGDKLVFVRAGKHNSPSTVASVIAGAHVSGMRHQGWIDRDGIELRHFAC